MSVLTRQCGALFATALIGVVTAVGGCAASSTVDARTEALRWEYREQLLLATRAINEADLEQAKVHVERARSRAHNFEQERKVDGLEHLIAGAEALREGEAARVRAEWSQIEDPALSREVRIRARAIGIEVPASPQPIAGKESQE